MIIKIIKKMETISIYLINMFSLFNRQLLFVMKFFGESFF